MALSATLSTLKDRLQLFSSEADTLTAICNSTSRARSAHVWPSTAPSPQSIRPPSARPRLPTEILDTIFANLNKKQLEPLLIANAFVSTVAVRRLYHDVVLARPAAIVAFLRTILANPRLPPLVRALDITVTKARDSEGIEPNAKARPTGNFYRLLARALRATTALTSLALELPKAHAPLWIFDGCTFRLRQLTTSIYCRRPLARFLETQTALEELTLRGYQTDTVMFLPFVDTLSGEPPVPPEEVFALAPEALPRLRTFNAVHADATLIRTVVQGRPVRVVSVPLFPDMSLASLDALQEGSGSLLRLSVISFDPTAPGFLFEALAARFQELEALHLVMLMAEYNQELLEQSAAVLSNFRCLKYITFMAAPTRPPAPAAIITPAAITPSTSTSSSTSSTSTAISTASTSSDAPESLSTDTFAALDPAEADIAKRWHRHCPTLRTIILPKGRVWFQNASGAASDHDGAPGGASSPSSPAHSGAGAGDSDGEGEDGGGGEDGAGGSGAGGEADVDMSVFSFSMEHGVQVVPSAAPPVPVVVVEEEEWDQL